MAAALRWRRRRAAAHAPSSRCRCSSRPASGPLRCLTRWLQRRLRNGVRPGGPDAPASLASTGVAACLRSRLPSRSGRSWVGKGEPTMARWKTIAAAAVVGILPLAPPALAHHLMGGVLPGTAWQGLLSGLGHPIIGIDHFAFVVGVGLMSQLAGRLALLPLLFIVGTVLGCFVHVAAVTVPLAEQA